MWIKNCQSFKKNISNPQSIVDNVDNFIQNMWKYDIFVSKKMEIHSSVDKYVNSYIHHPQRYLLSLKLSTILFSTCFQRDIHKLPTICGYLGYNVDFRFFSVEKVWFIFLLSFYVSYWAWLRYFYGI